MLLGALGLFKAFNTVDRQQWHAYISSLNIEAFYPGTLAIGYAQWLKPNELASHIQAVRNDGFPDFSVKPEGKREHYSSIVFLEPFNERNQRAFGFDMYSEPTRRQAMVRARDTGKTALSGKVTLVQEMTDDVQAGFLIYIPVYNKDVSTLLERRASLGGFVYSALRVGDLMKGILGSGLPEIEFEIYDGIEMLPSNLLYDSDKQLHLTPLSNQPRFQSIQKLNIGGREWKIYYNSNSVFDNSTSTKQPLMVAVGGIIIDFLLFNIILSLTKLRKRAQKLAEERTQKLLENEIHFKAITDTANDGIVSIDDQANITYLNKSAENIFAYSTTEVMGKPFAMLFPQNNVKHLNAVLQKSSQLSESEYSSNEFIEIDGINKHNDEFPLELSLARWKLGEKNNFTVVLRDITERRRLSNLKNEFVSTVSHELRTPLTAIHGSLLIVESGLIGPLNKQTLELIGTANRNCERLARLINDILDIEKIESGKMSFNFATHDVVQLIQEAIATNSSVAEQSKVKLQLRNSEKLYVSVDADRFMQVMTNLLANAIKYSPSGDVVKISVTAQGEQVKVSVTDRGPGVPEDFRPLLFDKFTQADSTDTRRHGGTGLGLSVVKHIVEKFGGEVNYHSELNKQTTFYFLLPVADSHEIFNGEAKKVV